MNGAISRLGTLGLGLLILSGIGLAVMMGSAAPGTAFRLKMTLVVAIVVFVGAMQILARRTRRAGDANAEMMMKKLAPLGPVLAVLTLIAAVTAFH